MFLCLPTRRIPARTAGASLAFHALGLAVLAGLAHQSPVRIFNLPGGSSGTQITLTYLPGRAPTPIPHAKAKAKPAAVAELTPAPVVVNSILAPPAIHLPPRPHLTFTPEASSPNASSPPAATPDATAGSDSWGAGDLQIAFTTYSPSPTPDLSVLPPGVQGDVIVDVTIDSDGKVANLSVLRTLGYGIESSVVSAVRAWTFRPATKNGIPIASMQELHFHFGPV